EKLLSSLSSVLPSSTPTGLAANLQLAIFFDPITDLSTMYFLEVACRMWEGEMSLPLMALTAGAAIRHTIRPTAPNVSRLASLLARKLDDSDTLTRLANVNNGQALYDVLRFAIQIPVLLKDGELFEKIRTLVEQVLVKKKLLTRDDLHSELQSYLNEMEFR